jgi:hypothetical protein
VAQRKVIVVSALTYSRPNSGLKCVGGADNKYVHVRSLDVRLHTYMVQQPLPLPSPKNSYFTGVKPIPVMDAAAMDVDVAIASLPKSNPEVGRHQPWGEGQSPEEGAYAGREGETNQETQVPTLRHVGEESPSSYQSRR